MIKESLSSDITQLLKTLPSRESEIIRLYYGIGEKAPPMSLSEIGEVFELSRERVRQIREKAIVILRRKSQNQVLKAYL